MILLNGRTSCEVRELKYIIDVTITFINRRTSCEVRELKSETILDELVDEVVPLVRYVS